MDRIATVDRTTTPDQLSRLLKIEPSRRYDVECRGTTYHVMLYLMRVGRGDSWDSACDYAFVFKDGRLETWGLFTELNRGDDDPLARELGPILFKHRH